MQVERPTSVGSGKRVSNTLVIFSRLKDNLAKAGLIPDRHGGTTGHSYAKPRCNVGAVGKELKAYQLVGRVMAYQGNDR